MCVRVGLCSGYNGTCAGPSLDGVIAEQFGPLPEENSRESVLVDVDFFRRRESWVLYKYFFD